MAKRNPNASICDVTGKIGNLVHYQRNGKQLIRMAPTRKKPFSDAEINNQSRFRLAQMFAASVLTDPRQQARYERAAAGADASAQNIAVSDFFHHPRLTEVDLSRYTGRTGEFIRIRAEEGRIGAAEVRVTITDGAKALLERGNANMETDGVTWWYTAQNDLAPDRPLWVKVTAIDQAGNRTMKTLRHTTGA